MGQDTPYAEFTLSDTQREKILDLAESFGICAVSVFGSHARGQATKQSDLDLLIETEKPIGIFKLLEFKHRLEDMLHIRVDIAQQRAIHNPYVWHSIKRDVRPL